MNSVKITYIIMSGILCIFLLTMAIISPIYFTPGYYWWTAFCILLLLSSSEGYSKRLNSWKDFGEVNNE